MIDHLRRIFIAIAIFACAGLVYRQWRVDQKEFGLFQFLSGQKPVSKSAPSAAGGVRKLREDEVPTLLRMGEESAKLAATVLPCVVSIETEDQTTKRQVIGPWVLETPTRQRGIGSGVIVSKEGHIITNYHVVKDAVNAKVRLSDGTRYTAKGGFRADPALDIAVIQIDGGSGDFPFLDFADSDKVKAGQLVFAIGSPFALNGSVSRGIISATQRQLSDSVSDLLQTDTVINPGNSGGPLVNALGEIVGINVALLTGGQEQYWHGVGLAIPANDVNEALQSILKKGVPTSGFVGIEVSDKLVSVDSTLGSRQLGAVVVSVLPSSPAAKGGLQAGDVITRFGGATFEDVRTLMLRIRKAKPGQVVPIDVVRDEKLTTLNVTIEPRPLGK